VSPKIQIVKIRKGCTSSRPDQQISARRLKTERTVLAMNLIKGQKKTVFFGKKRGEKKGRAPQGVGNVKKKVGRLGKGGP